MYKILKRLELIKTCIALEDEELIALQASLLKTMKIDTEVKTILELITQKNFSKVTLEIEAYITKFSGIVLYEDKKLVGLRLELKTLENRLQELTLMKSEYLHDIESFNSAYHLHLGSVLIEILNIRKQLAKEAIDIKEAVFEKEKKLYEELKNKVSKGKEKIRKLEKELETLDEFDDKYDEVYKTYQDLNEELYEDEEELNYQRKKAKKSKEALDETPEKEAYEEAKSDYESFHEEYEEVRVKESDRFNLNEEEQKRLKATFRKACRLCHPDIVIEELREQATELMKELNNAYNIKDLKKVEEILTLLESGTGFATTSDNITDVEILKIKIKTFRKDISELESELETIREDESYQTLMEVDDLEAYFHSLKQELEEQLQVLKNQFNESE